MEREGMTQTTIPIHRKDLRLEYVTELFQHSFDVQQSEYVEGTGLVDTEEERVMPVHAKVTSTLTDRAVQLLHAPHSTKEWYAISIYERDILDEDGEVKYMDDGTGTGRRVPMQGRDERIDSEEPCNGWQHPEKQFAPDIAERLKKIFPNHNVSLDICFTSGRSAVLQERDHYDKRDIYRLLVEQIATYVIQEAQQQLAR
jgi:hypothetical protein